MKHPVNIFTAFIKGLTSLILCSNLIMIRIVAAQQTCDKLNASAGTDPILSFQVQVPSSGVTTYQVVHLASLTSLFEVAYINGIVNNPTIINWCEYGPDIDLAAGKLDLKLLQVTSNKTGRYELKTVQTNEVIQCIDVILLDNQSDGRVTLSTTSSTVLEYSEMSLTCIYVGSQNLFGFLWFNDGVEVNSVASYMISGCIALGPVDANLYSYKCRNNTAHILIIKNVTKANQGQRWLCRTAFSDGQKQTSNIVPLQVLDNQTEAVILSTPSFSVAEYSELLLTCSYYGSKTVESFIWFNGGSTVNPVAAYIYTVSGCIPLGPADPNLYTYTCLNSTDHRLTIKNVTRVYQGQRWLCQVIFTDGHTNTSNVIPLQVLVPITSISLTSPSQGFITVTENIVTQLQCKTSSGTPQATVQWYKDNGTPGTEADDILIPYSDSSTVYDSTTSLTTSTLNFLPSRTDHGMRIYCKARNIDGSSWLTSSRKIQLTIHYASGLPSIQGFANNSIYYMIRNTSQTLTCSVTSGRPQPQLTWSCYNGQVGGSVGDGDTFSSSISWTSVGLESTCSCTSNQVLAGSTSTVLFIKLLYSPDTPTLTMGSKQVSAVYLTEEESLTITCNSISSPAPSRYTWLLPNGQPTVGQQLHIDSVQYHVNPVYTCIVENRMIPSQGAEVAGSSSAYLPVILFYSPRHINKEQSKEEVKAVPGTKTALGVTLAAFPLPSVYFWTRCKDDVCSVIHNDTNMFTSTVGLASTLTIMSTRKEDFGKYKLTASNGIGQPYNYTFFLRETVSANNQVSTETNTALIVGVVGGVVAVALIVNAIVIVLCLVRRKAGGGMEATSYQRSKKQTQYDDVQDSSAGQNDPDKNSGAGVTATSTPQSEYIGLSQYGNVQNPYEELGAGIDIQTRPEKTYTNVTS